MAFGPGLVLVVQAGSEFQWDQSLGLCQPTGKKREEDHSYSTLLSESRLNAGDLVDGI